jgi:hypothetical protein
MDETSWDSWWIVLYRALVAAIKRISAEPLKASQDGIKFGFWPSSSTPVHRQRSTGA